MSTLDQSPDTCSCCEGVEALTPANVVNRPGLSALAYRVGTHGSFKLTMLAAISKQAALRSLTTRDDDDPAIGLLDSWAAALDVLTFYQERIANEGYLRTATERRSILELARSIGYELRPGMAATTYLAFSLLDIEGAPEIATVPTGTKAQSIPGQDETAQTFETSEEIEARVEWNAMKARSTEMKFLREGDSIVYLKGTSTLLSEGDALVFIREEREDDPDSGKWDFRRVKSVNPVSPDEPTTETDAGYTEIELDVELTRCPHPGSVEKNPKVFALRKRAALFGYNAPDIRIMSDDVIGAFGVGANLSSKQWRKFNIAYGGRKRSVDKIYLDAIYPGFLAESWVVVSSGVNALRRIKSVTETSQTEFALTAKTTKLELDAMLDKNDFWSKLREIVVFGESEELTIANQPITDAVSGGEILLDQEVDDLSEGRLLLVSGTDIESGEFVSELVELGNDSAFVTLKSDDTEDGYTVLRLQSALLNSFQDDATITVSGTDAETGENISENASMKTITLEDGVTKIVLGITLAHIYETGASVTVEGTATDTGESASETATLGSSVVEKGYTKLVLDGTLQHSYERDSVLIYGNVVQATHGESKSEILGSGDGSVAFQEFTLKQIPLTYTAAATATGSESTLEIRVNDILWEEVPTLYGRTAEERVFTTRLADEGSVTVQFGDGITGARLPTGTENVVATYRVGSGLDGLVDAEQISLLMTRPYGVDKVTNPLAPAGADDNEELEDARENAPLTVLTLDRVVSLQDFEDFARAFSGIGKAQAAIVWNGERQAVYLTLAGVAGATVDADLKDNLRNAIDAARQADQAVELASYEDISFDLEAKVLVDPAYIPENVLQNVEDALRAEFSFENRSFGQSATASEILAIMQGVDGVIAVDLDKLNGRDASLYPTVRSFGVRHKRTIKPAQLLTIKDSGIVLAEMTQ